MGRQVETLKRLFTRVEQIRYGSDALAGILGFTFFSFSVGLEKLNPRNLAWLTFGDQQTHLLGWWFYASDQWRWPLGASPRLGWEGTNSIVYTDSWPGMAIIFKVLDIKAVNWGQYFGLGLLVGAVALFVGARRLFHSLGFGLLPSLAASALLGTTTVFWYLQRWYPALSAGLPILVWAVYFYVDDLKHPTALWRRWVLLLILAVSTHAYLTVVTIPILLVLLVRRFMYDHKSWLRSLLGLTTLGAITVTSMYALGYFTLSSKWAQTGGYGWYSANVLGLFDYKDASRFIPALPSVSGQYEPTALGLGTLLLLVILVAHRLRTRKELGLMISFKEHVPLVIVLIGLSVLAITNTISIGSWSYQIPIPVRLEHGLSIFRSSARMLWPTLIVMTVAIVAYSIRRLRYGVVLVSLALAAQVLDTTPQIRTVARAENGNSVSISYDAVFWGAVPERYGTIASLPAQNLGFDWASCTLAAVNTDRAAECGYFSRVQGLDVVNRERSSQVFAGALAPDVIYMVSRSWLVQNKRELLKSYSRLEISAIAVTDVDGFSSDTVFLFPGCPSRDACDFVGDHYRALDASLLTAGS